MYIRVVGWAVECLQGSTCIVFNINNINHGASLVQFAKNYKP